jgi:hypothetical protein
MISGNFARCRKLVHVITIILLPLLPVVSEAGETETAFVVEIESKFNQLQGINAEVNIYLHKADKEFSGFEFRIAYDDYALVLLDIRPGEYLKQCGWEYFVYRIWPVDSSDIGYPSGLVRIIARADFQQGTSFCIPDSGISLATLNFTVYDDRTLECQVQPVSFFWASCGDNKFYSFNNDSIFISDQVFGLVDSYPALTEITLDTLLPTYTGAPSICMAGIPDDYDKTIVRDIDFRNGFIDIICADSIDDRRCDLNLNGIIEIADAIIFRNYFIEGLTAFDLNPEVQMVCSDFNGDNIPLTIEDFVYLIRIIVGDAPVYVGTVYQADITIENSIHRTGISLDSPIPVGAVNASFNVTNTVIDSIVLLEDASEMEIMYDTRLNTLNVLVYSFGMGVAIPAGESTIFEIYYSGERPLEITADAGGYLGEKMDVQLITVMSEEGDINLNGVPYEIADAVWFTNYLLYGLSAFSINMENQVANSDINQNGEPLEINDFVYLINVITGAMIPGQSIDSTIYGDIIVYQDKYQTAVDVDFPDSISTIYMVFEVMDNYALTINEGFGYPYENLSYIILQDTIRLIFENIPSGDGLILMAHHPGGNFELIRIEASGYLAENVDLTITYSPMTDVHSDDFIIFPKEFYLYQNRPNPFNKSTMLEFDLPFRSNWWLEIYNIVGQKVRDFNGSSSAGSVSVNWDGRNDAGFDVSSGIYFYRLKANDFSSVKKMILLK